jgi:hypothetical protein
MGTHDIIQHSFNMNVSHSMSTRTIKFSMWNQRKPERTRERPSRCGHDPDPTPWPVLASGAPSGHWDHLVSGMTTLAGYRRRGPHMRSNLTTVKGLVKNCLPRHRPSPSSSSGRHRRRRSHEHAPHTHPPARAGPGSSNFLLIVIVSWCRDNAHWHTPWIKHGTGVRGSPTRAART